MGPLGREAFGLGTGPPLTAGNLIVPPDCATVGAKLLQDTVQHTCKPDSCLQQTLVLAQSSRCDQTLVPERVQVLVLPEPLDQNLVAAEVFEPAHVQRLMDIPDEMHIERQRLPLRFGARAVIAELLLEPLERFQEVTVGTALEVIERFVVVDGQEVPRRGLLPVRPPAVSP